MPIFWFNSKDFLAVNHVEHGRGTAPHLDAAKELAAQQALVNHRGF